MSYTTLKFDSRNNVAFVTFNRPEIHNAIDSIFISEFSEVLNLISKEVKLRAIVLTGIGKSFCAGADINWMRSFKDLTYDENLKESKALADLFYQIYSFPLPVIGRINGAAFGGGAGFVAACDISIATKSALFSFSEVKLGLAPSIISPYVIKKIGEGRARECFITGDRMSADWALQSGLINQIVDENQLDGAIEKTLQSIFSSGPKAVTAAKSIISKVPSMTPDEFLAFTTETIARLRVSEEGQEGMDAFLNKRKPKWAK